MSAATRAESDGRGWPAFPRRRPGRSLRPRRERSSSRLHRTGWRARGPASRASRPNTGSVSSAATTTKASTTPGRCGLQLVQRRRDAALVVARPAAPAPQLPARAASRQRRAMTVAAASCPHSSSARLSRARPKRAKKDAFGEACRSVELPHARRARRSSRCTTARPAARRRPCGSSPHGRRRRSSRRRRPCACQRRLESVSRRARRDHAAFDQQAEGDARRGCACRPSPPSRFRRAAASRRSARGRP